MFGNRDDVGARNFSDGDLVLVGGVEVDVVGAYTGGDTKLEFLGLGEEVSGEVAGVEGGSDEDLGLMLAELRSTTYLGQLLLEYRVRSFLVVSDDESGY